MMSENTNEYSIKHPHEPEIPATYDDKGRCLICVLLVQVAQLEEENDRLESEIYDVIFYEPHETDSWGKLTHRQLMALNELGRRIAYRRQERALLADTKATP